MRLKRKGRLFADLDVTSFSDLAFLLIIFFILTTTFSKPMGARLTIPSGTSDPNKKPDKELPTISLSRDAILLGKDDVTIVELRRRLTAMRLPDKKEDDRVIILESARDVPFERYYQVVTTLSRAGGILALLETADEQKTKP